jgi:prefoldin subunit 5
MTEKRVDINTLSPEALSQHRQQVKDDLEFMNESSVSLRKAVALFEQARIGAEKISECRDGQNTLVPITNSVGLKFYSKRFACFQLFMKGEIVNPGKLIVDIGTGYYVEMSGKRAVDFYKRKVEFVRGQLNTLRTVIEEKNQTYAILTEVLQRKIQALSATPPQS